MTIKGIFSDETVKELTTVNKGIEIELTSHCGMKCISCIRENFNKYTFLAFDDLKKIVQLIKEGNYSELMISGHGDAFLHKEVLFFIEYIFEEIPNINIFFITKGIAIKNSHLDKILDLQNKGFNLSLTFSIFSLNEKKYNYLTGGDFYKQSFKILNKVLKMNINCGIEFMLTTLSINEVENFKHFSEKIGKEFKLSFFHNWGGKTPTNLYNKLFDEKLLGIDLKKIKENNKCDVFKYNYFYIDSFGYIYACSLNKLNTYGHIGKLGDFSLKSLLERKNKIDSTKYCLNCTYG